MVNPGAFHGMRKEFLLNEKSAYARAVKGNYAADALANIQRRYFKRFPVDLPHDQEPTGNFLANINENAPDPEPEQPDPDAMSAEDFVAAMKKLEERKKLIVKRKAQIKRWLAYQYSKDHDLDANESGARNPYHILIHQLTGVGVKKPRQRSAANTWRKTQTNAINAEARHIAKLNGVQKNELTALRDRVARKMFDKLPKDERDEWEATAREEHQEVLKKWEEDTKGPPSTKPADRQRCIQGLAAFAKPVLDLICEATGWKASLIAGGPEPAHDGRLNVISVHSGTTIGDVKMNFGRAKRAVFKKHILPAFGSFLQKCYSVEECLARALPQEEGFEPLIGMDPAEEHGVFVDTFDSWVSRSRSRSQTPIVVSSSRSSDSRPPSLLSVKVPDSCSPRINKSASIVGQQNSYISQANNTSTSVEQVPSLNDANTTQPNSTSTPRCSPSREMSPPISPRSPIRALLTTSENLEPSNLLDTVSNSDITSHGTLPTTAVNAASPSALNLKRKLPPDVDASVPALPPSKRHQSNANSPFLTPTSPVRTQPSAAHPASPNDLGSFDVSTAVETLRVDPEARPWFSSAVSMFDRQGLGSGWIELVREWSSFERRHDYKESGRISAKHRPLVVKDWIQRARPTLDTWQPSINDPQKLGKDFARWWKSLQPAWRLSADGEIDQDRVSGDLEVLRKPGLNGMLSVLVALFYWGWKLSCKSSSLTEWEAAVADCHLVFRLLNSQLQ